jgi:hypothetical protein
MLILLLYFQSSLAKPEDYTDDCKMAMQSAATAVFQQQVSNVYNFIKTTE